MRKNRLLLWLVVMAVIFAFTSTAFAAARYQILMIGDRDEYVVSLQQKLIGLRLMEGKATGYFGTVTQQAVIDYQTQQGLTADGKAGPKTLSSLMGKDFAISQSRLVSGDQDMGAYYPGDKGSAIAELQTRLRALEYYEYGTITGYYGPVTQQAVMRFQRTNGLTADGIAGAETLSLLASEDAKYYCIYPGDKGTDVETLQSRLKELGYYTQGSVTGYFGTVTEQALREFQAQCGLKTDAKAGKNTRALLYSPDAPAWDGTDRVSGDSADSQQVSQVDKMLDFSTAQLDKKYVYSTEGPASFDCSGFVYYVLKYMGVSTARCSASGFSANDSWVMITSQSSLLPGDLLFFKSDTDSRISHAGIYMGGGRFIHASASSGCVMVSSMADYYSRNFVLARRVF
jgi:peptidoglycan hydrolase-like protein with peptidoglycan-binding domain